MHYKGLPGHDNSGIEEWRPPLVPTARKPQTHVRSSFRLVPGDSKFAGAKLFERCVEVRVQIVQFHAPAQRACPIAVCRARSAPPCPIQ
jgi:hypothetical protein